MGFAMPFDAALIRLAFDFLPDFRLSFFGDFFFIIMIFFSAIGCLGTGVRVMTSCEFSFPSGLLSFFTSGLVSSVF